VDDNDEPGRWMLVPEAADALAITENTLRTRLSRDAAQRRYRRRKGNDGLIRVWIGDDEVVVEEEPPELAIAVPEPVGVMVPEEAVLEIRATYEQIVALQKSQLGEVKALYEARLDDMRGQVEHLRQEMAHTRETMAPRSDLDAMHARHEELINLVKMLTKTSDGSDSA